MMTKYYPYALYLDNKIKGAAEQLVEYYENNIFDREQSIVYLRKYRKTQKIYEKILSDANIIYQFVQPSELDKLENQTIFYLFNAQSNCRVVANRSLKHVFVTHGESNKVSSIKPIIRIYDYVTMAGKLSLERYYKSNIFNECDYKKRRLLLTGNTFISSLGFDATGEIPVLFYAPTWEGGVVDENYSSLGYEVVFKTIMKTLEELNLNTILIKPHPNLGHRDSSYLNKLFRLALELNRENIVVYLYKELSLLNFFQYFFYKNNIFIVDDLNKFKIIHALVDVSAMESKCINELIPYNIFYHSDLLRVDLPNFYSDLYSYIGIKLDKLSTSYSFNRINMQELKDKIFDYDNDVVDIETDRSARVLQLNNFVSLF